jgi:hypothetical protein
MAAAEAAGILSVCAAGNSGVNADLAPMYPGGYDNRGILSVSATDQNDLGAYFTNYGIANVDLAAPGVSTLSTVPTGTCQLCDPSGYKLLSGTSMATPHVSAVAAAIFHLNPALTTNQARDVLLDPASYDIVTDYRGSMSSTGGRLNFQKVIANPLLSNPKLNNFPTITGASNVFANAGDTVNLTATASDPDGDPLRTVWNGSNLSSVGLFGWMASKFFPPASGNSISFQAPSVARAAVAPYSVSTADGRGGSATAMAYATVQPSVSGSAPTGTMSVTPTSGPVGTTVTVNFPVTDPDGGSTGWELWSTSTIANGGCCMTTSSYSFPINSAGAYRISTIAINSRLSLSNKQSTVVRIGGSTATPPLINATIDKLSGPAPLTVNVDMTGSTGFGATLISYFTVCQFGTTGVGASGPKGSCTYSTPGTYWMLLELTDSNGLTDVQSAYIVVTPPGSGSTKQPATVTLSNMTQSYTGSPLSPTAATYPPGLAITWTNAPQTNPGTYTVTATVNDPNYQGSSTGTFTITSAKQPATVTLGNMTQTYTGGPLMPSASTTPPGLAITWTNAPQTNAGTYTVTATVNDANYQGSASGTFTINKATASVSLSNLTQVYTGSALTPTAATTPSGLAITWTNAPQVNPGTYTVTATVNNPNYQGSNNGTFTVMPNSGGSTPPAASITSPSNGGTVTVKSTVSIQANVTVGTNPIARVDFLLNGAVICSDTTAAYSCSWTVPGATGKNYQIQAKAYDTAGQLGTSSVVTVKSSR